MIQESVEEENISFEIAAIRHAQLCVIEINMHKAEKEPTARVEDFLPKELIKKLFPDDPEIRRKAQIERARKLSAASAAAEKRARK